MHISKLIDVLKELNTRPDLDVQIDKFDNRVLHIYQVMAGEDEEAVTLNLDEFEKYDPQILNFLVENKS